VKCLLWSLLQSLLGFLFKKEFCCLPFTILREVFLCAIVVTKFLLLGILFWRIFVAYHLMIFKASKWWKCACFCYSGVWTTITMAMLHGTLNATIYQTENLVNVERSIGNTLALFKQVGIHSIWASSNPFKLSSIPICHITSQELLSYMFIGFQSYGSLEDLQSINQGFVCVGLCVAVSRRG
jgi:hypothetical protein